MQKCETFIFRKLGSDNYLFSENRAASIELIFFVFQSPVHCNAGIHCINHPAMFMAQ